MRRIFVDPQMITASSEGTGGVVRLEEESFRHAIDVLRLKKGDEFQVLSGQNFLLTVQLADVQKKSATAKVTARSELPPPKKPLVNLAVSLPRFATFEWIVEKSVELGVTRIQPLVSEFSFVKKKSDVTDSKLERWQKIIRSATEQTIRPDLLRILPVQSLEEWTTGIRANPLAAEPCLFGYESLPARPAREVLRDARTLDPQKIWALAGSEGGFSEREVQSLLEVGVTPATLGPQILRAETACVALISVIKYEFDHMTR